MKKKNLKKQIKKIAAGMVLACSLLTVMGSVSNEGIMPCAEVVVNDKVNI